MRRLEGVSNMSGVVDVYLSALRLPEGERLMVATGHISDKAIESYARC
jgi:hypothetical protein